MSLLAILLIVPMGALLASVIAEWLLARAIARAYEVGHLDHPTDRGSHDVPTPRVGGRAIAPIVIGAAAIILLARAIGGTGAPEYVARALWAIVLGGGVAFLVGLRDDIDELAVAPKSAGLLVAALLVAALLGDIDALALAGFIVPTPGPIAFAFIAVSVWMFMNGVNFMDGMDGLVSLFALMCLAGFAVVSIGSPAGGEMALVLVAFAFATIAFHRRNVTPVHADKTFLGDCGSLFAGLVLTTLTFVLPRDPVTGVVDLTPSLILFFPFLFDTGLTTVRRFLRGENITRAHHEHLYQRQLELGDSHKTVRARWAILLLIHWLLLAVVTLTGPDSVIGRLALAATPLPMLIYWRGVVQRERAQTTP